LWRDRYFKQVTLRLGSPLTGYGRDHGGRREGRRNFIEHEDVVHENGTKSIRIRFNVEGPRGKGQVFAEVAYNMTRGGLFY
jgi:import inner membrane translocase subunit TIM21